jgi:hypothetical protein
MLLIRLRDFWELMIEPSEPVRANFFGVFKSIELEEEESFKF